MKYRKTNKPSTNNGNKPYCKRILFTKSHVEYVEPELKENKKKEGQMFIPPVHKNKYIYPSNVSQKECKEDDTDTNTSVNESAFQNDLTPRKEQIIIQTQRKDEKSEIISRNAIKVHRITNDDNTPINSIKALHSTTSTLRDLIKTHKKANSELFFKEIDYSKSFTNSIKPKDENVKGTNDNNNSDNTNINKKQLKVNFTTVANSARQTISNQKNCSSLMRDKTVNHLLNNSLLHNSQHVSKFQSKNSSANSSMIQDNNSYTQANSLTARTTIKHILSTSMPCSSFTKNHHHNKSVSSLLTTPIINFQEVLEIQIKLNHILLKIDNNSSPHLELFSWWNYFYKSTFIKAFQHFFENSNNKRIVDSSLKLESLTSVLCLEISKVNTKCKKALELFKSIFSLIHFNFLIIIKFLLVKSKTSNIFADKLNNIIKNELSANIYNRDMTESFVAELIKHNTKNIAQYYKELIQKFYIDNKYSNSNAVNYNLNNSKYIQKTKENATRNIRINKKEENKNESIYYTFFTNAFSNLNAYTYDDYNSFILEYINNDDFDYDLDNESIYFKTTRNHPINDNNKILEFSDNFTNTDLNSNSIDIVMPDNLSAISNCSSQKDTSPRIQTKHRRTNSCTTTTISNSSIPHIADLLNQLMSNNNGSQTERKYDPQLNNNNDNENSFLNYNKVIQTSRSKSPTFPKQCPLLNSMYFLPEISKQHEYTLILDLDETLVHVIIDNKPNSNKAKVIYRPYLFEFLARMKHIYEIVIFTVSTEDYADKVCDCIEKKEKYFDYKLYRQHVTYIGREYYKDLSKLGRDLKKVVIVDNMPQNFALQKENGIAIKAFYGDCSTDKNLLYELGSVLEKIRFDTYEDVRKSILKYKDIIKNKISEVL